MNFAEVRKQKELAEQKVKDLQKTQETEIEGLKKLITGNAFENGLDTLAGDDKDLREKITFHYNRIKDPSDTKKDIEKKLRDAYILATGTTPETRGVDLSSFSSGVSPITKGAPQSGSKIKPEVQQFGMEKFGLTEKDFKKYPIN